MVHHKHCFCLLALLPAYCVASFLSTTHSSVVYFGRQAHLKRSEKRPTYPVKRFYGLTRHGYHGWHYSSPAVHSPKFTDSKTEGPDPGMIPEGKKEDEQRDSAPIHSGVIPLLSQPSDGSGAPSSSASLAITAANTPVSSTPSIRSTSAVSSFFQYQSQSEVQATQTQHTSTALVTSSGSSPSSSSAFSPALLAFILVPVCVFLLGMSFALYRIYGRPGNRAPQASPMFLGDATARGSGYHRDEVIAMNDPTMELRDSILGHRVDKRGSIKWEPRVERNLSKSGVNFTGNRRNPLASHGLMPPFRAQGAESHHTPPSRVLRPHFIRPYNRSHPAFTADPEAVVPLIVNGSKNRTYNISQDGYATPNSKGKGKGKENYPQRRSHDARKHRADISTTPLNTSPRSLPFRDPMISAVFSDMDIRLQARTQLSAASLVSMTKDKSQLDVPSKSSTVMSPSFDIGVAMLTDFSSPNVGLGLDLSPCPPHNLTKTPLHSADNLGTRQTMVRTSRDSAMPYLEDSATVGSKGLAYLSGSSQETILADKKCEAELVQDELDIASALAVYRVQHAGDRLKDQNTPLDQMPETQRGPGIENHNRRDSESLASASSNEARYTPSDIKAPTLPTLSEMALSRADPLYESVTNELFSTYGMRMSIVNAGQKSRVSARISRMLSWFAGADSNNAGSRISGVEDRMSCEDSTFSGEGHRERMSNMSSPGGVQPLKIGKLRKNAA